MLSSDSLIVNKWLPDDLKVIGFRELPEWTPSLNSSISSALYRFTPYQEMEEGISRRESGNCFHLTAEVEIKKVEGQTERHKTRNNRTEIYRGGFEAFIDDFYEFL